MFKKKKKVPFPLPEKWKKESEVAQSCPTLCNPMDSSLHQAPLSMGFSRQEYQEWIAISFSRTWGEGEKVAHTPTEGHFGCFQVWKKLL